MTQSARRTDRSVYSRTSPAFGDSTSPKVVHLGDLAISLSQDRKRWNQAVTLNESGLRSGLISHTIGCHWATSNHDHGSLGRQLGRQLEILRCGGPFSPGLPPETANLTARTYVQHAICSDTGRLSRKPQTKPMARKQIFLACLQFHLCSFPKVCICWKIRPGGYLALCCRSYPQPFISRFLSISNRILSSSGRSKSFPTRQCISSTVVRSR